MSQKDTDALKSMRAGLVDDRRTAAAAGDAEAVVRIQRDIAVVDIAILDEQALGQHEKDEVALSRAIKRVPDARNVD